MAEHWWQLPEVDLTPVLCEVSVISLNDGLEMHPQKIHHMNSCWGINWECWRGQADIEGAGEAGEKGWTAGHEHREVPGPDPGLGTPCRAALSGQRNTLGEQGITSLFVPSEF